MNISDTEENVGFIRAKVMRNLRRRYVFYAGGLPVLLWGDLAASDQADLFSRLQIVAKLTKERLIADFPRIATAPSSAVVRLCTGLSPMSGSTRTWSSMRNKELNATASSLSMHAYSIANVNSASWFCMPITQAAANAH